MSAFVVSHDHIDAMLTWAVDNKFSYWNNQTQGWATVRRDNATDVGQMLLRENVRSVLHRYPDCKEGGEMPGTIGETPENYRFRVFEPFVHMPRGKMCLWVFKATQCFDYQACETDDYEGSQAARFMNELRSSVIMKMPGYNDAPWGIDRPEILSVGAEKLS
jgi:hypothetical protein